MNIRSLRCTLAALVLNASLVTTCMADAIILSTDFESGLGTGFSGSGVLTGTQGYSAHGFGSQFLRTQAGNGASNGISVSLTDLPAHSSVSFDFLLAVIDSWDGVGSSHGPDGLSVEVDGTIVFSEIFENSGSGSQTYIPAVGATLARRASLGFAPTGSFFADSAYDMSLDATFQDIPHVSDSLTIQWYRHSGSQINGSSSVPVDESWAIDNLSITLNGTAVPEPASYILVFLSSLHLLASRRRCNLPLGEGTTKCTSA